MDIHAYQHWQITIIYWTQQAKEDTWPHTDIKLQVTYSMHRAFHVRQKETELEVAAELIIFFDIPQLLVQILCFWSV